MSLSGLINISGTIQKVISGSTSTFTDKDLPASNYMFNMIIFIIILYVLLYITMFIGSYLFNNSVVKIFSSTKKITIFEFFCLYFVIHMLFSCNCNCNSTREHNTTGKSNFINLEPIKELIIPAIVIFVIIILLALSLKLNN